MSIIYSTSLTFVKFDAAVTLSEEQGHRNEKRLYRPLVGQSSHET